MNCVRTSLLGYKCAHCPIVSMTVLYTNCLWNYGRANERVERKFKKNTVYISVLHMHVCHMSSVSNTMTNVHMSTSIHCSHLTSSIINKHTGPLRCEVLFMQSCILSI